MWGFPKNDPLSRCGGKSKQSGEQCRRVASPFTDPPRCIIHGANHPAARARAEERMHAYAAGMLDPLDPPYVRRMKVQAWERSNELWVRRKMKKAGLLDDYDRQKAEEKRAEQAAVRQRAAERERAKKGYGQPSPTPVPVPAAPVEEPWVDDYWGTDWSDL